MWSILQKNYGGGPAIIREAIDIYAKEPKAKIQVNKKKSNNKAMYMPSKAITDSIKLIGGNASVNQKAQ